jgi:rhodanese-related sulfurtransferase
MMTADELAFRILDRDPSLQMVDVRSAAAFSKMTLPGAVNIPAEGMLGKEWRDVLAQSRKKKVFFADNEEQGGRAATLAEMLGYENVAALKGGLGEFTKTILRVHLPERELTRDERDTYAFRLKAAPQLPRLLKSRARPNPSRNG